MYTPYRSPISNVYLIEYNPLSLSPILRMLIFKVFSVFDGLPRCPQGPLAPMEVVCVCAQPVLNSFLLVVNRTCSENPQDSLSLSLSAGMAENPFIILALLLLLLLTYVG